MEHVLRESLGEEWYELLKDEFSKDYMLHLMNFVKQRRAETTVYPTKENVFNAYKYTPYSRVKVCIIGQDPYINPNEAHGLSFSTLGGKYTPSLKKIEAAIRRDCGLDVASYEWSNNLTRWSDQGIMLLNTVLTVDAGKSNSHKGHGWENFTLKTVQELDKKGIIFLLWGKDALSMIDSMKKSVVFIAEHPVAASYQGRAWNNKDCFNRVNELLTNKINW